MLGRDRRQERREERREARGGGNEVTHYQMRQRMISIGDDYVIENDRGERVFVVAIVGHGHKHDATLAAYQRAARKNAVQDKFGKVHVEVVSFDAVTDPEEIAFDLITLVS